MFSHARVMVIGVSSDLKSEYIHIVNGNFIKIGVLVFTSADCKLYIVIKKCHFHHVTL